MKIHNIMINSETLKRYFDMVTVPYGVYKSKTGNVSDYPMKYNSYKEDTKTCKIFVPNFYEFNNRIVFDCNKALINSMYEPSFDEQVEMIDEFGISSRDAIEWIIKDSKTPLTEKFDFYGDEFAEQIEQIQNMIELFKLTNKNKMSVLNYEHIEELNNFIIINRKYDKYFDIDEIPYFKYKKENSPYKKFKTIYGSYSQENKTIKAYIPKYYNK